MRIRNPAIKDVQATEEAFSPQKRTPSPSKLAISRKKFFFCGSFCPPGFGYGSTDLLESGGNTAYYLLGIDALTLAVFFVAKKRVHYVMP